MTNMHESDVEHMTCVSIIPHNIMVRPMQSIMSTHADIAVALFRHCRLCENRN